VGQDHQGGLAVLRVGGAYSHAWRIGSPVERRGRDARQLRVPQTGSDGQSVAQGSARAGHPQNDGTDVGGFHEAVQFGYRDGSSVMAAVFLGVVRLHPSQDALSHSVRVVAPDGERPYGRAIVVQRLERHALRPERRQCLLHAFSRQVAKPSRRQPPHHPRFNDRNFVSDRAVDRDLLFDLRAPCKKENPARRVPRPHVALKEDG
jgi:hypothetical protein